MAKDKYKLVGPEFHSFVGGANEVELKEKLVELNKNEHQVYKTREEDSEYQDSKQKTKELGASYSEVLKELKQKRSLILNTLDSQGK